MSNENTEFLRVLSAEAEKLQARRTELEQQSARIRDELEEIRKRQELVVALLEASGCPSSKSREIIKAMLDASESSAQASSAPQERGDGARRDMATIAYEILLARGRKPMHYTELAAEVVKAGGRLGGATPAQTLVARISRDPRFVRPEERGWYAARDFYKSKKNVGARRHVKRRKKAGRSTL